MSATLFHFSNIARRHSWVLKPFRNPHWYLRNIFSKICGICLYMHFWNTFGKFGRMLTTVVSFITFSPFCRGVVSACLIISGNYNSFMELLKVLQKKLLKILVFPYTTFLGISELCDALFTSSFKIYFWICFRSNAIKLKLSWSLHLFWIVVKLAWFL